MSDFIVLFIYRRGAAVICEVKRGKTMSYGFSYKPYIPFEEAETFCGISIVRVAPDKNGADLEWLGTEKSYTVKIYKDGSEIKSLSASGNKVIIDGLDENAEYSVAVFGGNSHSETRIFRTGEYLGKVINYLHPSDGRYDFGGRFLGSPSIVRFKGDLYASMDVFRGDNDGGAFNLTLLYRSRDDGKNWEFAAELVPLFWGELFVAGGRLCILGCSTEFGSLTVSASDDGENWDDPVFLMYGAGHGFAGPHKSPCARCVVGGKIWFSLEFGSHKSPIRFDCLSACVDEDKVMNASAWTFSEKTRVEYEWGGGYDSRFAIEGNTVERNGEIFILMRFTAGKALMLKCDRKNPKNAPAYHKTVNLPIGHCKFYIQKAADGIYYAMGNTTCYPRHVIQIYKSEDLENWEFVKTVEDISSGSAEKDGVQYPSFFIDGDKLYTVLRVALNGSDTFHNSNATVFNVYDKINE